MQTSRIEITVNTADQALVAMREAGKGQARRAALMQFVQNWFGLLPEQSDLIRSHMSAIGTVLARRKKRKIAFRSGDT